MMEPAGPRRGYWVREAMAVEEAPPSPPLQGDAAADVAILGGGYTGLWTAHFLTERSPGIDVVLLELDICGGGPSGRNGGFAMGWWDDLSELVDLYGDEAALRVCRAVADSTAAIGTWCEKHGVDAWYTDAGYMGVASAPAQDGAWSSDTAAARRLGTGEEYRDLSQEEVQAICASPVFGGGVFMRDAATVQPARLARGLRRVLIERGVRIHEGTPALRLGHGPPATVETPGGTVRAGHAVVALNAWAASWREFRRSLVVRPSFQLITAPAPQRLEEIGWTGGECITDLRAALHYFRTTPDGRIAFGKAGRRAGGNRIGARYDYDQSEVDWVLRGFRRIFPSFSDVPIEDVWGGPIDLSPTHHAFFGSLPSGNVHYGLGYTGNGVAPSHLGGRILAALATGGDDEVLGLPIVGLDLKRFPPEPLRSIGAALVQRAVVRKEAAEDAGRRPGPLTRFVAGLPRRFGYALGPE